jgi:hypothetical protein
MKEILHQLIGGKHPIVYSFSTIPGGKQKFATIHLCKDQKRER